MSRHFFALVAALTLIVVPALIMSCTDDDIATTPSPPFLFTDMIISKNITPRPGTTLKVGDSVTVRFQVDYTLATSDDNTKSTLGIFGDIYSEDVNSAITLLDTLSSRPPGLTSAGGVVARTMRFKVPADARTVTLEAYIDTIPAAGFTLRLDSQSWNVVP